MKKIFMIIITMCMLPLLSNSQNYERQRAEFASTFEENFEIFHHFVEGAEFDPAWSQIRGEFNGEQFVGYIPVRNLRVEPNATLGLITFRGVEDMRDGTYLLKLNESTELIEFYNQDNELVADRPTIINEDEKERLRIYSEEDRPIGSKVGRGGRVTNHKIKKRIVIEVPPLPGGDEMKACVGIKIYGICIGIWVST